MISEIAGEFNADVRVFMYWIYSASARSSSISGRAHANACSFVSGIKSIAVASKLLN